MPKRQIFLYLTREIFSQEQLEEAEALYHFSFRIPADFSQAMQLATLTDTYEGAILSLSRPCIESYSLIDELNFLSIPILVIPDVEEEEYRKKALRLGANVICKEPYDLSQMLGEIFDNGKIRIRLTDRMLDEKISNIFLAAGIPPHIKGYQFLREAVKQSIDSPDLINHITKKLYPSVARRFETTPSKVERAIRHAIEVAWARGKIDNINTVYGVKVFQKGEKPTNGELIALISDKLMIEMS